MTTETNKATVRRYIEQVLENGRADLVEEFMVEGIELHGANLIPGLAAIQEWIAMFNGAFPNRQVTVDDIVAEGDRVVVRTTLSGTHLGTLQGIPASGNSVSVPSITIFHLSNGKIVEAWTVSDSLVMMQQLGVMPAPQEA